ncbi:thiamine phosphate synthase [Fibrobacter sp.]|uniref:thiamine phosphate synthase n=1 Tax=Fibrobacter sp. TaxID=35828 RepID=UPI00386A3DF1
MRLWITTAPDDFSAEFDDIEQMFSRGLSRLILQKRSRTGAPYATESEYERWLMALPMECRDRIWVRGTPDLAERLDVRGCVAEATSLLGDVPESWKRVNCIAFCRNLEQLEMLPEWVAGALVGPVFQPQSVYEPVQVLGVETVADKLTSSASEQGTSASKIPQVIAFGGIDHENLDEIKKLPVQGVSVLGGIWNYADPVNAFIKLSRAI